MIATTEAGNKEDRIRDLLRYLESELGQTFLIMDHWDCDKTPIGIAAANNPHQLVYISLNDSPANTYFVELETAPTEGSDFPYTVAGTHKTVNREQLLQIVSRHLRTGASEPAL